jgi:hypothetical protein
MAIPPGVIGVKKLVEMYVAAKHGLGSIAAPTIKNDKIITFEMDNASFRQMSKLVVRAGVAIPKIEDDK